MAQPTAQGEVKPYVQLQMIWPAERLGQPPVPRAPDGYRLRTYRPGDEAGFYRVMALAGWPDWDAARLRPVMARILPGGWFLVEHQASGALVATAMAQHDHSELHPFGGEMGWVAGDPAHARRGLGLAVCAAVTARLIAAGYQDIHLLTDDWRLPALKTYLRLGYVPFLHTPEMAGRWQAVYGTLGDGVP